MAETTAAAELYWCAWCAEDDDDLWMIMGEPHDGMIICSVCCIHPVLDDRPDWPVVPARHCVKSV